MNILLSGNFGNLLLAMIGATKFVTI